MYKTALTALAACTLTACSISLPVQGQIQNSAETFTGVATGYMDGAGHLTIVSSNGATCKGNFVYVNGREGRGTFTCDDKRTGPFDFVSTGKRGTGTGHMSNGDKLIFTFGE